MKNKKTEKPTAVTDTPLQLAALPSLDKQQVRMIATGDIVASPFQPRKDFPEAEMAELREHIRTQGIQIPLLGRETKHNQVELIAGERRWRCATALKLAHVPMIVRELTDEEVIRIQRAENAGRENLKALETAEDYLRLQTAGKTVEEICALHGVKRSHVYTRLRVAKLPAEVKQLVRDGKLAITIADLVAKLPTTALQLKAAKHILDEKDYDWQLNETTGADERVEVPISFREAQRILNADYTADLKAAPFDVKLDYEVGNKEILESCTSCPFKSGNIPGATGNPNVCTKLDCYQLKTTTHATVALAQAAAAGKEVISKERYATNGYAFAAATEKPYQDDKGRTYAALAKLVNVPSSVTVNREGAVVEVFTPEAKKKILELNKLSSQRLDRDPKESAAAKAKREAEATAIRCAITDCGLRAANEHPKLSDGFWRKLTHTVLNFLGGRVHHDPKHWTGRGLTYSKDVETDQATLRRYVDTAAPANLVAMCVQLLVDAQTSQYDTSAFTVWGVDWKQFLPNAKTEKAKTKRPTKQAKAAKVKTTKPAKKGGKK